MSDFDQFFLMKTDDVKRYAVEVLHFFKADDDIKCVEIGDGNINYVFKAWTEKDGRSVIVKQADKLLRSSGRPLDLYRNKIEAQILMLEKQLAPAYIPEVYHYDETMAALSMEDISAYGNLRKELAANHVYGHLAENLSNFLADVLLPTTDLVMESAKKKQQVKFFINPELCDITEDLVLTEPYYDPFWNERNKNIITAGNEDFVKEFLFEDTALQDEVAKLRVNFMNNAQSLIHGDLHSGSIMATSTDVRVIDPEFAFFGPMGFDVGALIGNLILAYLSQIGHEDEKGGRDAYRAWILKQITDVWTLFSTRFVELWSTEGKGDAFTAELFTDAASRAALAEEQARYMRSLFEDTLGFAGCKMIRRILGLAHVADFESIADKDLRASGERRALRLGRDLVVNRTRFANIEAVAAAVVAADATR